MLPQQKILQKIKTTPVFIGLQKALKNKHISFHISGLKASATPFYISELTTDASFVLVICDDNQSATAFFSDLQNLNATATVLFFPETHKQPYQIEKTDNANILMRATTLEKISDAAPKILVTYPDALYEKIAAPSVRAEKKISVKKGDVLDVDFFNEVLFEYGFQRVDFVSEAGEFAVRGGIVDVFSFTQKEPIRVEFTSEKIAEIRFFDVETQITTSICEAVKILPNLHQNTSFERIDFLDALPSDALIVASDNEKIKAVLDEKHKKATEYFQLQKASITSPPPEQLFTTADNFLNKLNEFQCVFLGGIATAKKLNIPIEKQPTFGKNIQLFAQQLEKNTLNGFKNYICCADTAQISRLEKVFEGLLEQNPELVLAYELIPLSISGGFLDTVAKIACYTDHQIFGRYYPTQIHSPKKQRQNIALSELTELSIGDYITHIDHGVGKFGGMQKIEVGGQTQEAIKLVYAGDDVLYVNIHTLHKITKFKGKDATPPKIYKLGSGQWKKLKAKTKKRVKEIAFNLIAVYAKRKSQAGFAYSPDSPLQHQLESSFMYEDTPDQTAATQAVKKDMEAPIPMDRLICGDVGFGKTEIAMRAAFKAADNCKQVAVLVPTTLLAFQHYQSFKKRFADFPVRVDYLSRFRTAKARKEILQDLKNGEIDIVIGTHALVSQQVAFQDLGLLIIDEEQKFGVGVKDKLKALKTNLDTLTLTATPIPRTLQFSLMAARDMSLITTPPPNRYPIETEVIRFNEAVIKDGIAAEVARGGQVFFIHNRIENLKEVTGMLQRILPNVRIRSGHGQMDGKTLEKLMIDFIDRKFDVLVATSIIESGLDVPNANTIFINGAENFGLSDLHQMRGRVGRSNRSASCFLITPPFHLMKEVAQKRVQSLSLFSDLGSGIHIAMKDLEIRGAGDLLGGEQSGFINEMGFETYQEILAEAVAELKQQDFKGVYNDANDCSKNYVNEVQIESDEEMLIPDDYINNVKERFKMYKRLAVCKNENELQVISSQLADRFGCVPKAVSKLFDSIRLKWYAMDLGIEKVILKQKRMVVYFVGDAQSDFYKSDVFAGVLQYVQTHRKSCFIKEKETKKGKRLMMTFIKINDIKSALQTLKSVLSMQKS